MFGKNATEVIMVLSPVNHIKRHMILICLIAGDCDVGYGDFVVLLYFKVNNFFFLIITLRSAGFSLCQYLVFP